MWLRHYINVNSIPDSKQAAVSPSQPAAKCLDRGILLGTEPRCVPQQAMGSDFKVAVVTISPICGQFETNPKSNLLKEIEEIFSDVP